MSISFNGTNITAINYNGTSLSKVIYNGTEVWSSFTPAFYCWINGYNGSTYVGTCYQLKQNSTAWELVHTDTNGINYPVMSKGTNTMGIYTNSNRNYVYQYSTLPFTTWTNSKCSGSDVSQFSAVQNGKVNGVNTIVGISSGTLYTSTDGGVTFTQSATTFPTTADGVFYVNGQFFVAFHGNGVLKLYRYTGSAWTEVYSRTLLQSYTAVQGMGYKAGLGYCFYFLDAFSSGGYREQLVAISSNLSSWTNAKVYCNSSTFYLDSAIASNNSVIGAKDADNGFFCYTTDGSHFTETGKYPHSMYSDGTNIVIVGNGSSYKTTNGTTWTTLSNFPSLPSSKKIYMNYVG